MSEKRRRQEQEWLFFIFDRNDMENGFFNEDISMQILQTLEPPPNSSFPAQQNPALYLLFNTSSLPYPQLWETPKKRKEEKKITIKKLPTNLSLFLSLYAIYI